MNWVFSIRETRESKKISCGINICEFYQLEPYLEAGYTVEDITTAVKTGWKMLGITKPPEITYHKDTKVLIAVGEEDKVNLIADVLKQLSTTPKEKSNDKNLPKSKDHVIFRMTFVSTNLAG